MPPAVHDGIRDLFVARGFPASGSWPKVIEYFGKNVGVRRSRGAFVLATNPDDVFHRKLVQSFGLAKLAKIHFYRAQRTHCAKWGPLQKGAVQTRHGVAEKCAKDRRLPPFWDAAKRASKGSCASGGVDAWFASHDPKTHASVALTRPFCYASGDFWLMHRKLWHAVGGYIEAGVTLTRKGGLVLAAVGGLDGYSLCRALGLGVPQVTLDGDCVTLHLDHDKKHANGAVRRPPGDPVPPPPFDDAAFARVEAAWRSSARGPRRAAGGDAAAVAAASAAFTRAWADTVGAPDGADPNWSNAGCKAMGKVQVRRERLFDADTKEYAPSLFGWPELTLPAVVVWPPGLSEDRLGRCR